MKLLSKSILSRNKNFRTFFVADSVGKVADSYFLLLLPFLLKDLTKTGFALGLALATNALTKGVISLFGGVLADKYEPQRILAWHNSSQMISLLFLWYLLTQNLTTVTIIFVISGVFGVLDGLASPAASSAAAKIVPKKDLLEANSYLQGLEQLTAIIGPVGAGLLTSQYGLSVGVACGAFLYMLSTVFFGIIYRKQLVKTSTTTEHSSVIKQIQEGLLVAKKSPIVLTSLLLLILNNLFITGPAVIGLVLLYENRFRLGADIYAYSGVLFSIGFILGIPLVKFLTTKFSPSKVLLCVYILYGFCLVGIGFAPSVWWVMVAYFLVGPGVAIDSAITVTWLQNSVKTNILGRVGSLVSITALALDPISQALTGWGSDWSITGVFILSGTGITCGFLLLYMMSASLRNIDLQTK